jgi:hypothetical protein
MSMQAIEAQTRQYAIHRDVLRERVQALNDEIEALKRRRLPGIRSAITQAQAARDELAELIGEERGLFAKKRTQIFHGIKVGVMKGKGLVSWADPAKVVELIKRHLADQQDALIKTEEKPIKSAIANLPAADLKRIGCNITETGDQVYIAPVDSEIDRIVDALLKDSEAEIAEAVS